MPLSLNSTLRATLIIPNGSNITQSNWNICEDDRGYYIAPFEPRSDRYVDADGNPVNLEVRVPVLEGDLQLDEQSGNQYYLPQGELLLTDGYFVVPQSPE